MGNEEETINTEQELVDVEDTKQEIDDTNTGGRGENYYCGSQKTDLEEKKKVDCKKGINLTRALVIFGFEKWIDLEPGKHHV